MITAVDEGDPGTEAGDGAARGQPYGDEGATRPRDVRTPRDRGAEETAETGADERDRARTGPEWARRNGTVPVNRACQPGL
ncbi:hypothetical protein Misp03_33460 [Microbispora sp. NBRC 16548]|nr:hypothetical protein Misp03_33460 [Microbispora sp. NBRC 16548]